MGPILLKKITEELGETVRGAVVSTVHQPEAKIIILKLFIGAREYRLLLSADPRLPRMHLTLKKYPNPKRPMRFSAFLRKHITGAVIEEVGSSEGERIAQIKLKKKTDNGPYEVMKLTVELTGKSSNIILTDDRSIVLDAIRYFPPESSPRAVSPGFELKPLPQCEIREEVVIEKNARTWNESADLFYSEIFEENERQRLAKELRRTIKKEEKRLLRKIKNLEADIEKAEGNIENSKNAELLQANFKKLERGMKEIELDDVREAPQKKVVIKLDERLDPKENIERIRKLAKKGKRTIKLAKERLPGIRSDLEYTRAIYLSIDEALKRDKRGGLDLITGKMIEAGLLKKKT